MPTAQIRSRGNAMYMRVVRGRLDPSKLADVDNQLGQDLTAAIRRQPGCQSSMGGVDRASGRSIVVTTWDTEEHARYSPDALGDVMSKLRALGLQADPPEIFEVTTPT
jgi:hypothetical protein